MITKYIKQTFPILLNFFGSPNIFGDPKKLSKIGKGYFIFGDPKKLSKIGKVILYIF